MIAATNRCRPRVLRSERKEAAAAFTILELLVSIGVIAVLVGITAPSLQQMRYSSRLVTCLTHSSQLHSVVAFYSTDYQGHFPSQYSDRPEQLASSDARFAYGRYPYVAFAQGPLPLFSQLLSGSKSLACPSNQFLRGPSPGRWAIDYSISTAAYLDSRYLDPDLPADQVTPMRARVARMDDAAFPWAKAGVYEAQVWHDWPLHYSPESDTVANQLFHWGTHGRISIAFLDGHAEQLYRDEVWPAIHRSQEVLSSILNTTPYGMRGRDMK